MSLNALSQMRHSGGLVARVTACVAQEGEAQPENWVVSNLWKVTARSDWIQAWAYAEEVKTVNVNPDTGQRDDVITDAMILAAVQAVRGTPA